MRLNINIFRIEKDNPVFLRSKLNLIDTVTASSWNYRTEICYYQKLHYTHICYNLFSAVELKVCLKIIHLTNSLIYHFRTKINHTVTIPMLQHSNRWIAIQTYHQINI